MENLAKAVREGLSKLVRTLSTFWAELPSSNLTTVDGVSPSPTVAFLQGGLAYWTAALAVLAIIVGGTWLAWEQRGGPMREMLRWASSC
jgi:type IV secretion system protein TrbL